MTSINKYAKTALDVSNDKPKSAVNWLCKTSARNADLKDALVRYGAQQIIRTFFSQQRSAAMTMAAGRVAANMNNPKVQERVAARVARVLFWDAYTLFGMTPIKDANKEMLLKSAESREAQANTEMRLAKFERTVAKHLTGTKTVKQCMTSKDLEAIASKFGGVAS
jgi:hypothetical protein